MTSNPEPIVQQVPHDFQNLLAYVTGPNARSQTAYTVELTLCRRLLALGEALLRLFFVTRAAVRPAEPVTAPDGTRLTYHDQRPTTDDSVFGKVRFGRHFFTAPGQAGLCALDAALSLPARCDSDLRREWAVYGTTDESYRESQTILERILGLSLSVHALETCATEAGADVTPFYKQPADPMAAVPAGTILVVPADGKGVPMVQPPTPPLPVRLGKGQKRGKKEAVVTGLYTIAPSPRTPQEVVGALLQEPGGPAPTACPRPEGKELRATLEGKAVAMRSWPAVTQREGPHLQQRVALTDGAEALPQQLLRHFPEHTLVLDIIHATESRWDTANALLGETHPQRVVWFRAYLEALLAGKTAAVITALEAEGKDPPGRGRNGRRCGGRWATTNATAVDARQRISGVWFATRDRGGRRRLWASGEGSHGAVREALEESWGAGGVDLRAVRLNGHWDRYWPFHRQQQHQRLDGTSAPVPERAEGQALEFAA